MDRFKVRVIVLEHQLWIAAQYAAINHSEGIVDCTRDGRNRRIRITPEEYVNLPFCWITLESFTPSPDIPVHLAGESAWTIAEAADVTDAYQQKL